MQRFCGVLFYLLFQAFGMVEWCFEMLKVKEISKSIGKNNVLNQLSFSTQPGEIIGLVGENGAGKSTLLKILATIEKQDQGCITFDGVPYEGNIKDIRKKIG